MLCHAGGINLEFGEADESRSKNKNLEIPMEVQIGGNKSWMYVSTKEIIS
jgi:hypothetical protein